MSMCFNFILFISFLYSGILAHEKPVVKTKNGLISGIYKKSFNGRDIKAFIGIPYAKPPIGNRRFKAPEPMTPWHGVWVASTNYMCMQLENNPYDLIQDPIGTEDCLYLNVYSPKIIKDNASLDVIVHIPGGAFMHDQALYYGPEFLLDYSVIYVNFNYRLGPLGFLSTEDDVVPGNNGLKDQTLALKWIKDNIHNFGGNPDSITITGASAGSASVQYHYLSPLSRGLFKRGISISGTALCNWVLVEHPLQKTKQLGALLGCEQNSSKELVDCLRQRSPKQIVESVKKFLVWLYNPHTPFGPVVEPKSTTEKGESFLPDLPYNMLKNGQVADVEWITSVTSEEGLYPAAGFIFKESYLPELDKNWEKLAPYILHFHETVPKESQKDVAQKIKQYYLNGKSISKETYPELVQAVGDRVFVVDAEKAARLQAKVNKAPVYFYKFSYRGDHSYTEFFGGTTQNYGVSHGDDNTYVTHPIVSLFKKFMVSEEDKKISKIMINMWLMFASTGKPQIEGVEWPEVSKNPSDKLKYLHFISPDNIVVEEAEHLGHRTFWDSLPFKENNLIALVKDEL